MRSLPNRLAAFTSAKRDAAAFPQVCTLLLAGGLQCLHGQAIIPATICGYNPAFLRNGQVSGSRES